MPASISHFKQLSRPTGIITILLLSVVMAFPSLAAETTNKDNAKKIVGAINLFQEMAKVSSKHILTEDELGRLLKAQKDIVAATIEQEKNHPTETQDDDDDMSSMPTSIDDVAKSLDVDPKMHKIIASYGFTAREYIIVSMALNNTASEIANPNPLSSAFINPKNIAFVHKHQAEVDKYIKLANADE